MPLSLTFKAEAAYKRRRRRLGSGLQGFCYVVNITDPVKDSRGGVPAPVTINSFPSSELALVES